MCAFLIPPSLTLQTTRRVLHVASPSFLPLYALLSGNDYVPDWILTPLQKALNAHVIYIAGAIAPKILSETLGLPAPCKSPPVLEVADAACRAFADSFDNSERAAALSRDTFRSVLSDAHATFCTPRPPECAVATPARALPAALKEAFARGWVGQELALLALKDADAVWKYTPLPELPSLPPAYAAALPVRKQVYRLLIPVCGGGPSLRVTEYSRDRLACPLREAVVVEASVPPAALSLEGLWGAAAGARPSAAEAVAYFLQGVLPQAPEHAETKQYIVECLKGDAALALAFLVGASGVLHMWELNALLIGLLMSTHFCAFAARKTGKDDVTDLLDAFVAANAKDAAQAHTGRFAHVGSVVLASLHSLVFADEMSRWSLFGGCDGTSPLTELLAGLNMEACLVPYADMRRLYDSMRFAEALPAEAELAGFIQRMRLSSAESGAGTFATSPFDCPDGVGDLTAYLLRAFFKRDYAVSRGGTAYRGAAADLDTDAFGKEFAALVRAKAEVLLRCLAYADREGACVLGRRQAAYRAWPVASLRLRVEPDGVATVGDAAKANLAEAHRRRSPVLVTAGGVGDLACSAAACVQGGALVLCGGGGTEDARSTTVSHSLHACGSGALLLEQACVAAGKKCVNLVPQTACVTDVRTLRARAAVVAGDENAVVLVAGHSWLASFRASGCPSEAVTSHGQLCLYNVTRDMREALWPFLPTAVSLGVFSVGPVERHFAVVVEADASADVPQEDAAQGGGRPPSVEVSERSAYY